MADIADDSDSLIAAQLETSRALVQARLPANPNVVNLDCEDCGNEIPRERSAAMRGCTRCIECQTVHERS